MLGLNRLVEVFQDLNPFPFARHVYIVLRFRMQNRTAYLLATEISIPLPVGSLFKPSSLLKPKLSWQMHVPQIVLAAGTSGQ